MEYKLITEDRYDEVIQFLRDTFFYDEPLNNAVDLCPKGSGNPDLEQHCLGTMRDNLSLMAVTEEDEIAGVILNGTLLPGDIDQFEKELALMDDEKFKKIMTLIYTQNIKNNLFEQFNVDKAFDVRILSVGPRFRGQGIAKELVRRSTQLARDFGFKIMKGDATGLFSQKILRSSDFKLLAEVYYDKYTDEFGNPKMKVEPPHLKLELLCKLLD